MKFLRSFKEGFKDSISPREWAEITNPIRNTVSRIKRPLHASDEIRGLFDLPKTGFSNVYFRSEPYYGNESYGMARHLRAYSQCSYPVMACIEHGVYFGKQHFVYEVEDSGLPGIITYSKHRKDYLRNFTDKPILTLGPYINYVKPELSEKQIREIKAIIGKTLLVFPAHSTEEYLLSFSWEKLRNKVFEIVESEHYNTVLVSMFYRDLNPRIVEHLSKSGFIVVCSGHVLSTHFLPRLKSLFQLADCSISNSVGTHIGYSIACGCPHTVVDCDGASFLEGDTKQRVATMPENFFEEISEVASEFTNLTASISDGQKHIIEKYWGILNPISPEMLEKTLLHFLYLDEVHKGSRLDVNAKVDDTALVEMWK